MQKSFLAIALLCVITSATQASDLKSQQTTADANLPMTVVIRNGYQNANVRYAVDSNGTPSLIVAEGTQVVPTGNLVMTEDGSVAVEVDCIQQ